MQYLCLMLVALAGVYLGWADMQPALDARLWLARAIRMLIVLCAAAAVYALIVVRYMRPDGEWRTAVKRAVITLGGGALLVLAAVLMLEAGFYFQNPAAGAPVETGQLVAVSVVMLGLVAALLSLALLAGRDPLGLSERGRMLYVYAAQAAGALLFAHLYLGRPEWFHEELRQYWPYIVMAIAFAGCGVGELFQRAGVRVLAEPLQRSGAFLPLIPALGMWILASQSDYSLLLFAAGLLYVFLSISRKSTTSGIAAAIAGNGALWSLLHEQGFALWQQPQVWMIPPAVSVLCACEINRRRLPDSAVTGLRYGSMLVIYLSSSGEMFIRGLGQQLWPPMILLGLSVAGALLGVALRVRAFLYIGSTFAFLSVVSMVWHASRAIEHVWPWWAFGIGLGLAVLILFGIFEKQREQVTGLVERLREWER